MPKSADMLLTRAEVARLFGVKPDTVSGWAKSGRLVSIRTLGGHRRFRYGDVVELLEGPADA